MPAEIQDAIPDIVIGGEEIIEDEPMYGSDVEEELAEDKASKKVSFAGLDEEQGENEEEKRQREFEEGGGLPEQPVNPDFTKLTPISPEIINRQATINIGTIGHVAHGKSTVVRAISGVQTVRFKNELERNITIKLGYALPEGEITPRIAAERR